MPTLPKPMPTTLMADEPELVVRPATEIVPELKKPMPSSYNIGGRAGAGKQHTRNRQIGIDSASHAIEAAAASDLAAIVKAVSGIGGCR